MHQQAEATLAKVLRLYRAAAIAMIALIAVGCYFQYLGTDSLNAILESTRWGRPLIGLVLVALATTALGLWYASVRYALLTTELVLPRAAVVTTAVLGNVTFAFLYFWFAVNWRQETRRLLGANSARRAAA